MKISARNQLRGKVSACNLGSVNAEVIVELAGGDQLVAVVTIASVEALELKPGAEVIAFIKAPSVMVLVAGGGLKLSARNCLEGTLKSLQSGAVNAEVILSLSGGSEVVAIITSESMRELGLKVGDKVTAVIKASQVVLGVATQG